MQDDIEARINYFSLTFRSIFMLLLFTSARIRQLLALWASLFAFALLAACSPQPPEDVVKDFMKAVAANKVDDATRYFALADVKENDMTTAKGKIQMMAGQQYAEMQKNDGLDSISATTVKIEGDRASVTVELKFKNGKTRKDRFNLAQESGKWKIVLK
jgi:hypothetical protein